MDTKTPEATVAFTRIPSGQFTMGKKYFEDNKPHPVFLDSFDLGIVPVTNSKWVKVIEEGAPELFKAWEKRMIDYQKFLGDNKPAVNITWYEWVIFCQLATVDNSNDLQAPKNCKDKYIKMTAEEFLREVFNHNNECSGIIHPPSEAQWEKAAQGGKSHLYGTWNGTISLDNAVYNRYGTTEVGTKKENPYGLFDMSGNVWEWVADIYTNDLSILPFESPVKLDSGKTRVIRGGFWGHDNTGGMESSARRYYTPDNWYASLGFRPARTVSLTEP